MPETPQSLLLSFLRWNSPDKRVVTGVSFGDHQLPLVSLWLLLTCVRTLGPCVSAPAAPARGSRCWLTAAPVPCLLPAPSNPGGSTSHPVQCPVPSPGVTCPRAATLRPHNPPTDTKGTPSVEPVTRPHAPPCSQGVSWGISTRALGGQNTDSPGHHFTTLKRGQHFLQPGAGRTHGQGSRRHGRGEALVNRLEGGGRDARDGVHYHAATHGACGEGCVSQGRREPGPCRGISAAYPLACWSPSRPF